VGQVANLPSGDAPPDDTARNGTTRLTGADEASLKNGQDLAAYYRHVLGECEPTLTSSTLRDLNTVCVALRRVLEAIGERGYLLTNILLHASDVTEEELDDGREALMDLHQAADVFVGHFQGDDCDGVGERAARARAVGNAVLGTEQLANAIRCADIR